MTEHKVYVRHRGVEAGRRLSIPLIKRGIKTALKLENVDIPCEVSVLITDDTGIREINREFRGLDKPTDVLSFPMQTLIPGDFQSVDCEIDPSSGIIPLGDIILSAQRVDKQAREYNHSRERETLYLTVHSVLHLLGYDHMDEGEEKKQMRTREKEIIRSMQTVRKARSSGFSDS